MKKKINMKTKKILGDIPRISRPHAEGKGLQNLQASFILWKFYTYFI